LRLASTSAPLAAVAASTATAKIGEFFYADKLLKTDAEHYSSEQEVKTKIGELHNTSINLAGKFLIFNRWMQ
jgi:hypothetical protein